MNKKQNNKNKIEIEIKKENEARARRYKEYVLRKKKIEEQEIIKEKMKIESFPFSKNGMIKVQESNNEYNNMLSQKKDFCNLALELKNKGNETIFSIYGVYSIKENLLYIDVATSSKIRRFAKGSKSQMKELMMTPTCRKWNEPPIIKVLGLDEILKTAENRAKEITKNINNSEYYKVATIPMESRFEGEIAAILVKENGDDRLLRVLKVVTEYDKECCAPGEMVIREMERLGRELLGRIANKQLCEFNIDNTIIKIEKYKIWPGKEYHLEGFVKFHDLENIQDVIIMRQKNLERNNLEYEMVTALVYCENREKPVYIDVYYSKQQNKYFINEESYQIYSELYGLPYIRLVANQCYGGGYENLRQYSELNLYGYSVSNASEMTTNERQNLLGQLMDSTLMSKHQIVNHLEWLIHSRDNRISMDEACKHWREDLEYVNNYNIKNQRKIQGKFVYDNFALHKA